MPRLPMPSDTEEFSEETRAAVRHILKTRNGMPPPSRYLTYAGQAGALLSDLVPTFDSINMIGGEVEQ